MVSRIHTGSSKSATPRKEESLYGIMQMRTFQFKSAYFDYNKIIFIDAMCGEGYHMIDDEMVNGSPIQILDGVISATNRGKPINFDLQFRFNDVEENKIKTLERHLEERYSPNDPIPYITSTADVAKFLSKLKKKIIKNEKKKYYVIFIDPNNPSEYPYEAVRDIINTGCKNFDIVLHFPVGAFRRVYGYYRNPKNPRNIEWIDSMVQKLEGKAKITEFDIAKHVLGDVNWIYDKATNNGLSFQLMAKFGFAPPRNGWKKMGILKIK